MDTSLTRRALVGALGAGWATAAFAAGPPGRQLELVAAWHAARRSGAPLLVVVVPEAVGEQWLRGRVVGAALSEAPRDLVAALEGHVVAAATPSELAVLGVGVEPDAWFALVTTDLPATTRTLREAALQDQGIDEIGAALLSFLGPAPSRRGDETGWRGTVPGAVWARVTGCGVDIEGESTAYGCGMGSIPDRGATFLIFVEQGSD